jgi:hypothetical protein
VQPPSPEAYLQPQYRDRLKSSEELRENQKLWANNGWFYFVPQDDGNVVVYKAS